MTASRALVARLSLSLLALPLLVAPLAAEDDETGDVRTPAEIVEILTGEWSFEVEAPGGGPVQATGRRIAEVLAPDLAVSWSETYEGSDRVGRGFTGFDAARSEFYSMSVHSDRSSPSYMTGRMGDDGMVLFEPMFFTVGELPFQVVMEIVSDDEITYYPRRRGDDGEWEIGWRAVFRRAPAMSE